MTYKDWIPRVEELTGLNLDTVDLSAEGPVLLVPMREEVGDLEAKNLLNAVSDYLLGPTGQRSAVAIRERINSLTGSDLLPLLYGVRLVAAKYGGTHMFWPPFREHLLNDVVKDHDIPNQIAPALTRAWLRLHQASGGSLYVPTEGPTHIKWPIAHAGLVSTDTDNPNDPLILYGCELKSEEPTGLHELLLAEPQDFLQDLRAWMSQTPERAKTHLAHRVLNESFGPTIGELAQRTLRQRYSDLPCHEVQTERSVVGERPSVRVVYDSTRQRLQLRIRPGLYRQRTNGRLKVGNKTRTLIGHFDSLHKTQRFNEETIPIALDAWPEEIQIDLEDLDRTFSRRPPRNPFGGRKEGALLCDADTGRQTRQWRPETAYTLITTQKGAGYVQATECLTLALGGGEDVYDFPGFLAYPAFSLRFEDYQNWDQEATQINQDLETLDAQFVIPPASEIFAPTIRPVGVINHRSSGIPQYQEPELLFKLEPAEFEWPKILLERWVAEDASFKLIAELVSIEKEGVQYVGFGSPKVDGGRYRLGTERVRFEFDIEEPAIQGTARTARISLSTTGEIEERDMEMLRSPTNEKSLDVLGPPEASVRLTARTQEKVVRLRVDLDTEGSTSLDTSRFGLPSGTGFLQGQFLGRTSNIVTLIDGPYIAPGTWDINVDPPGFDAWVEGIEDDILLNIDVIGSRPWLGELARHHQGTRFGRIAVSPLALSNWDPAWLIVSGESGPPLLIEEWPDSKPPSHFSAEDFGSGVAPDWKRMAVRLSTTSLPLHLARLVSVTKIAGFAADHPAIRQPKVWRLVDTLEQIRSLAEKHIPLTVVVANSAQGVLSVSDRPNVLQHVGHAWMLRFGNEYAPIDLVQQHETGTFNFIRTDGPPLAACGSCGALMPNVEATMDHLGAGPNARCRAIDTSVPSAKGVVLYKGSASQLVREVGAMLTEGIDGRAGPPPAGLIQLVEGIRDSFRSKGIPQEGHREILLKGLNLALEVIDMFEHQSRFVDLDRIIEVATRTTAAGEIAYAILSETNILEGSS